MTCVRQPWTRSRTVHNPSGRPVSSRQVQELQMIIEQETETDLGQMTNDKHGNDNSHDPNGPEFGVSLWNIAMKFQDSPQ